jgi:hypothetical protein
MTVLKNTFFDDPPRNPPSVCGAAENVAGVVAGRSSKASPVAPAPRHKGSGTLCAGRNTVHKITSPDFHKVTGTLDTGRMTVLKNTFFDDPPRNPPSVCGAARNVAGVAAGRSPKASAPAPRHKGSGTLCAGRNIVHKITSADFHKGSGTLDAGRDPDRLAVAVVPRDAERYRVRGCGALCRDPFQGFRLD